MTHTDPLCQSNAVQALEMCMEAACPEVHASSHTHLPGVHSGTAWLKFILIFYLYPGPKKKKADKKHKCSWYCVLSYRAAKDWNPAKQFSEEMEERGLLNPGGGAKEEQAAVRGGRISNKRQRISKIDKCTSHVTFPFAAPTCEHFTILHLGGRRRPSSLSPIYCTEYRKSSLSQEVNK